MMLGKRDTEQEVGEVFKEEGEDHDCSSWDEWWGKMTDMMSDMMCLVM